MAFETLEHVPSATPVFAAVHALHTPTHGALQQTPSTQLPVKHSAPLPQTAPWAFWGRHVPALQ